MRKGRGKEGRRGEEEGDGRVGKWRQRRGKFSTAGPVSLSSQPGAPCCKNKPRDVKHFQHWGMTSFAMERNVLSKHLDWVFNRKRKKNPMFFWPSFTTEHKEREFSTGNGQWLLIAFLVRKQFKFQFSGDTVFCERCCFISRSVCGDNWPRAKQTHVSPGEGAGASQLLNFWSCFLRGADRASLGAEDLKPCMTFMNRESSGVCLNLTHPYRIKPKLLKAFIFPLQGL